MGLTSFSPIRYVNQVIPVSAMAPGNFRLCLYVQSPMRERDEQTLRADTAYRDGSYSSNANYVIILSTESRR